MNTWSEESVFYHIYPLGLCGAPQSNDFSAAPQARINRLADWAKYLKEAGFSALYLGPVFESGSHGYDTADYFHIDRRLGTNTDMSALCGVFRENGIRVVLDAVFNHVGRDFWAFRDVRQNGMNSSCRGWFKNLDFSRRSPCGDAFSYETWRGHHSLVKLDLRNPAVRAHIFKAVEQWVRDYDINGLRLDAADCMDKDFLGDLAAHCRSLKADFWVMGEVAHGNYSDWANPNCIDSVTNYEAYKSLYSSFNDENFFEIAWTLNRLSGPDGICRHAKLYNFADNHDVDRIASKLKDIRHLHPLYCLLFAMPGIPSVYYGSEFGLEGRKSDNSDAPLRPELNLRTLGASQNQKDIASTLKRLAGIRRNNEALRHGNYRQIHVEGKQLAFLRQTKGQSVLALINAADSSRDIDCRLDEFAGRTLYDILNPGWSMKITSQGIRMPVDGNWARIAVIR